MKAEIIYLAICKATVYHSNRILILNIWTLFYHFFFNYGAFLVKHNKISLGVACCACINQNRIGFFIFCWFLCRILPILSNDCRQYSTFSIICSNFNGNWIIIHCLAEELISIDSHELLPLFGRITWLSHHGWPDTEVKTHIISNKVRLH